MIIPAEAEIVRRIYREYLEGFSPSMIADGLMEDEICTRLAGKSGTLPPFRAYWEMRNTAGIF